MNNRFRNPFAGLQAYQANQANRAEQSKNSNENQEKTKKSSGVANVASKVSNMIKSSGKNKKSKINPIEKKKQEIKKEIIKKLRMKLLVGCLPGIGEAIFYLTGIIIVLTVILYPVYVLSEGGLGTVKNFFYSVGNFFQGKGWCATDEECNKSAQQEYNEYIDEVTKKISDKCGAELGENVSKLISATVFYGQMSGVYTGSEEPDEKDIYYDYFNANDCSYRGLNLIPGVGEDLLPDLIPVPIEYKGSAIQQAKKYFRLLNVYSIEEREDGTEADEIICNPAYAKYKETLIKETIPNCHKGSLKYNKTEEEIADEIFQMADLWENKDPNELTIVDNIDGLFSMLPSADSYRITSNPASCRCHPLDKKYASHRGIDIGGAAYGTSVLAFDDGIIESIKIATTRSCGSTIVKIKHQTENGDVYYTRYVHLNRKSNMLLSNMKVGDQIKKGQVIGYVGGYPTEDSCSTGAHLHFEVHNYEGKPINPLVVLNNVKNGLDIYDGQEEIISCAKNGQSC